MCEEHLKRALSPKEEAFVQALVQGASYVEAYRAMCPKSQARATWMEKRARNLSKRLDVQARYKELSKRDGEEKHDDSIADSREILAYFTAVMRGERKDTLVISCKKRVNDCDEMGRKVVLETAEPVVMQVPATLSVTNRAAELLGKRYGLFTEGSQVEEEGPIQIIDDIVEGTADAEVE